MRKKYVNWWCGLLLLFSSFPVITWCGGEILDTTTAAVASKLNPISPPPSSSVNSTSEQTASKTASATVSVISQTLDSEPAKEQQTEVVKGIVEELHSSFEESTEVDEAGTRQNSETLSETSSASLPSKHSDSSDVTTSSAKILHAEETLATLSSSLLVEPHNGSLTPENNVTDIAHEGDAENTVAPPPHVSTTTPAPIQVPSPAHASSEVLPEQPTETAPANQTDGEEIPSFNEWAQKQLEEAEKRKVQNASEPPRAAPKPAGNLKLRSKNYASPDCGAKILAANPEAQSVSSVLSPSRDEYALNPCTSTKIWFVVELCEAVQAKQVDLANFELFSSSPKEFSVWISDRFPTREWHAVGQFTAQDERTVQSFGLEQQIFAKFMRIELHSHWGSEHFCPVSLLRVFGVSEIEVLDTEEEGHSRNPEEDEDGDDDIVTVPGGDAPKNLFGSARDAVISIVKKAAQVLVKTGNSRNMTSDSDGEELDCGVTPLLNPPGCLGCSPRVLRLLACRGEDLQAMLASPYVVQSLHREGLCQGHIHNDSYLAALLPNEYISALCQLLPAFSQPHHATPSYDNLTIAPHDPFILLHPSEAPSTCSIPSSSETSSQEEVTQQRSIPSSDPTSEIRPTKTLKEQESSEQVQSTGLPEAELVVSDNITVEDEGDAWSAVDTILSDLKDSEIDILTTPAPPVAPPAGQASIPSVVIPPVVPPSTGHTTQSPHQVVTIQIPPPTPPTQAMNVQATQPPSQQPVLTQQQSTTQQQQIVQQQQQQQGQQKESVFVRLANRIKALERNMSLSAQYLEELSKRYKKQVEEMQRAFERTLTAVGEASRQAAQREVQHAESLAALEQRLSSLASTTAALMAERDSWHFKVTVLSQHVLLFAAVVWFVLLLVRQCTPVHREITPEPIRVRRHSVETLCTLKSRQRKRRPSEEAGASSTPLSAPPVLNSPFIFSNPSCERRCTHISEWRNDPSRKKRRRLRRELRGVSVEELCSGLSPATLAAVRPRPAPLPPSTPHSMEPSRRHSTESSPLMVRSSLHTVHLPPEPPSMFNGPVETLPASPCVQPRKTGGLRKMVRKLF